METGKKMRTVKTMLNVIIITIKVNKRNPQKRTQHYDGGKGVQRTSTCDKCARAQRA